MKCSSGILSSHAAVKRKRKPAPGPPVLHETVHSSKQEPDVLSAFCAYLDFFWHPYGVSGIHWSTDVRLGNDATLGGARDDSGIVCRYYNRAFLNFSFGKQESTVVVITARLFWRVGGNEEVNNSPADTSDADRNSVTADRVELTLHAPDR